MLSRSAIANNPLVLPSGPKNRLGSNFGSTPLRRQPWGRRWNGLALGLLMAIIFTTACGSRIQPLPLQPLPNLTADWAEIIYKKISQKNPGSYLFLGEPLLCSVAQYGPLNLSNSYKTYYGYCGLMISKEKGFFKNLVGASDRLGLYVLSPAGEALLTAYYHDFSSLVLNPPLYQFEASTLGHLAEREEIEKRFFSGRNAQVYSYLVEDLTDEYSYAGWRLRRRESVLFMYAPLVKNEDIAKIEQFRRSDLKDLPPYSKL